MTGGLEDDAYAAAVAVHRHRRSGVRARAELEPDRASATVARPRDPADELRNERLHRDRRPRRLRRSREDGPHDAGPELRDDPPRRVPLRRRAGPRGLFPAGALVRRSVDRLRRPRDRRQRWRWNLDNALKFVVNASLSRPTEGRGHGRSGQADRSRRGRRKRNRHGTRSRPHHPCGCVEKAPDLTHTTTAPTGRIGCPCCISRPTLPSMSGGGPFRRPGLAPAHPPAAATSARDSQRVKGSAPGFDRSSWPDSSLRPGGRARFALRGRRRCPHGNSGGPPPDLGRGQG